MILAVYREFGGLGAPTVAHIPEGETLEGLRRRMPGLPEDFDRRGLICINGQPVPRALWGMVRPKPTVVTEVTFHARPMGGGGGGDGKNVLAIVASIALMAVSGAIAGGKLLGALTGATAAQGTVMGHLLAGGVSLAGQLLLSALAPPPVERDGDTRPPGNAAAQGNVLEANGSIPRVVGERKIYPPLGCEPLTYFDGPDEVVEAAYVLAGPHRIQDIRIGAAEIASMTDVEFEVREGWPGDPLITLLRRQSRTQAMQAELRGHVVSDTDSRTLDTTAGDVSSALPQAQVVATRDAPDEHQLQLVFAQGLHRDGNENALLRVPVRLRIRPVGGAWQNLPELHFQAASVRPLRTTIRLVWGGEGMPEATAASEGWAEARYSAPDQTEAPAGGGWQAHPSFYTGSGPVYLNRNNAGSTGLRRVSLSRYTATIALDPTAFPPGRYEIETQRGAAFLAASYNPETYQYIASVWALFGYRGTPTAQIVMSRQSVADTLHMLRSVSVWNEHPLPSRDLGVVAVRARNRQLDRVSCVAGGYVRDWDGSGWNDWTVTDNPAPHYRDILVGAENVKPVPLDILDDDELAAWRAHCAAQGYTCNAILQDQSVDDAARIVAACGYAQPRMSDLYGVIYDRGRSSEAPVQLFTARNISGFRWSRGFADLPEGFRVTFADASRDYDPHQISEFALGASDDSGAVEQVSYEGVVSEADARSRAAYDLRQPLHRGVFYNFDCGAEYILARRGDLVAVQHDMLTSWAGAARVVDVENDGDGGVVAVSLDAALPVASHPFMDGVPNLATEPNLALLGRRSGAAISRGGGVTVHPISGSDGIRLEFAPPLDPDGLDVGALVSVGPLGTEYLRLIVFGISPKPNLTASVTLVDEAPQLWT